MKVAYFSKICDHTKLQTLCSVMLVLLHLTNLYDSRTGCVDYMKLKSTEMMMEFSSTIFIACVTKISQNHKDPLEAKTRIVVGNMKKFFGCLYFSV
jgi:hypothetical protein